MFFAGQPYRKNNSIYQPFQTNVTILYPLRIPTWSVIYCSLMTTFEFLWSLLDWCSWKTSFSASLIDFFWRETYLKVLAWRNKVSILPSKFRQSSSADFLLAEFRRWRKCEQTLEWRNHLFNMNLSFLVWNRSKKAINNEENFENTSRIVGRWMISWWIRRIFFC